MHSSSDSESDSSGNGTSLDAVSVHVLVLEAVARTQFLRYCPHTAQFLESMAKVQQAFVFNGFHSQAPGSTIANMMPMLTGATYVKMNPSAMHPSCQSTCRCSEIAPQQ